MLSVGYDHETVTYTDPEDTDVEGSLGASGAYPVMIDTEDDCTPSPYLLTARTVNAYVEPEVRPDLR